MEILSIGVFRIHKIMDIDKIEDDWYLVKHKNTLKVNVGLNLGFIPHSYYICDQIDGVRELLESEKIL